MAHKLLRRPAVLQKVPFCVSTLYQKIAAGTFPAPYPISERAVAWLEEEVDSWIEERIAARDADADRAVDEEVDDSTSSSEAA